MLDMAIYTVVSFTLILWGVIAFLSIHSGPKRKTPEFVYIDLDTSELLVSKWEPAEIHFIYDNNLEFLGRL